MAAIVRRRMRSSGHQNCRRAQISNRRGGEWLAARRRKSTPFVVGIEPESITAATRDRLASTLKGKARLRSAPPLVERARMVRTLRDPAHSAAVELGASLFGLHAAKSAGRA